MKKPRMNKVTYTLAKTQNFVSNTAKIWLTIVKQSDLSFTALSCYTPGVHLAMKILLNYELIQASKEFMWKPFKKVKQHSFKDSSRLLGNNLSPKSQTVNSQSCMATLLRSIKRRDHYTYVHAELVTFL